MKKFSFLITLFFLCAVSASAQDVIRVQECSNDDIKHQVDSLKTFYKQGGFSVVREASITMESEYEMPVIVPLQQGTWYQFVFIGDMTSKLYEVRMYDWSEKEVAFQQKRWGDVDGNIISYSYIPRMSEYHMMKPVQVNKKKKKGLCGYVMLLKKTSGTPTGTAPTAR
ncbi:MAG TPA: hypothetical protein VM010_02600 [Chitinophagaceae bacterium]|nr:hypothetical protein [Chitinophagaceae bacterium]